MCIIGKLIACCHPCGVFEAICIEDLNNTLKVHSTTWGTWIFPKSLCTVVDNQLKGKFARLHRKA